MAQVIEHEIPSKQRHYAGTLAELRANLLEREIGLCTENNTAYIKGTDGTLYVMGGGSTGAVQADWSQTDSQQPDYIKNKPEVYAIETGVDLAKVVSGSTVTVSVNTTGAASGNLAFAEGDSTTAGGESSHAEGKNTTASGNYAHAEGCGAKALGVAAHAEGLFTETSGDYQHAGGQWNKPTAGAEVIGGGSSQRDRKNIRVLDWSGNETIAGKHYGNGAEESLEDQIDSKLNSADAMTDAYVNSLWEEN